MPEPPKIGISRCLLGDQVRYNGLDKFDGRLCAQLRTRVVLVPVCPEVECGLGVPRPPMRLETAAGKLRLMTVSDRRDLTSVMTGFCRRRVAELAAEGIRGFIFKSRSPSCGLESVPYYDASGAASATGSGIFAAELRTACPGLVLAESQQLEEPAALAEFLRRVFAAGFTG